MTKLIIVGATTIREVRVLRNLTISMFIPDYTFIVYLPSGTFIPDHTFIPDLECEFFKYYLSTILIPVAECSNVQIG